MEEDKKHIYMKIDRQAFINFSVQMMCQLDEQEIELVNELVKFEKQDKSI